MILDLWKSIRQLVWPRDLEELGQPWLVVLDGFRGSPKEIYDRLELEVKLREMPGVFIERVELHEAGLFSDQREYLCVRRERFRFEFCAAPFGTIFFFSLRTLFVPPKINRLVLVLFLSALVWGWLQAAEFYGWPLALLVIGSGLLALVKTLRNVGLLGWESVDAWLLNSWFVGGLYETFFRPETRFRQDVRSVFFSMADSLVKHTVDSVSLSKGVRIPLSVLEPPRHVLLSGSERSEGVEPPPP